MQIEPFEIHSIVTGTLRLDGGAMFGVVPKVLWEKTTEPDAQNRIPLATRTLLAVDRTRRRVVLVDTGCGTKWAPEEAARFEVSYDAQAIPVALQRLGLSVEDVTDVIATHLHFDHNGGLTRWFDDPGGPTELIFPAARHWLHRSHWKHAQAPTYRDRASFFPQDFAALSEAGVIQWVEGDAPPPPFEGVEWFLSHGHTPYQLLPIFGGGARRLMFIGDMVPTVAHLRLTWGMGYDLYPLQTIQEKEHIYRRCFDAEMSLAFAHDPRISGVAIDGTVERPVVARALPLDISARC